MSARIDTAKVLTKSEKLARAMDNVMSGGRAFNRQLAAQARDELRSQQREIDRLTAALSAAPQPDETLAWAVVDDGAIMPDRIYSVARWARTEADASGKRVARAALAAMDTPKGGGDA